MIERRKREVELLRCGFGQVDVGEHLEWVIIRHYPLISGWNRSQTEVLVTIPPGYPNTPPDNFFTDNDLRLSDGNRQPENTSPNIQQLGKAWLQFSFHVQKGDWQPHMDLLNGHNLLTFMEGVRQRLLELS
jgi:hypothetical protein